MAETAAHLVDEVFPKVGIRQWVLSFPMPVRFILARHSKHQSKVITIVHRAIATFIKQKAKNKGIRSKLKPGAVTLIQRFELGLPALAPTGSMRFPILPSW